MFETFIIPKENKKGFWSTWGLVFLTILGVSLMETVIPVAYVVFQVIQDMNREITVPMVLSLFSTIGGVIWMLIVGRGISKWNINNLGIRLDDKGWKSYLLGVVGALILFIPCFLPALLAGQMTFVFSENFVSNIGLWMLFIVGFMIQSFSEELMCRGYLLRRLNQRYNIWVSLIWQSLIFSVLHAANPNVTFLPLFNIFLYGFLFGLVVVVYDDIMFASGLHFMWNFAQGCIFGIQVSGMSDMVTVFNCTDVADTVLTGGTFGVEGSIVTTIILAACSVAVLPRAIKVVKEKSVNLSASATIPANKSKNINEKTKLTQEIDI